MSEVHDLTDKEVKAIEDAASLIKKFSRYISNLNLTNRLLKRNLEESIKAGDVTNAQKVALRNIQDSEKCWEKLKDELYKECKGNPECQNKGWDKGCPDTCIFKQKHIVADWMRKVAHGDDYMWKLFFKWALVGRFLQQNRHYGTNFSIDGLI